MRSYQASHTEPTDAGVPSINFGDSPPPPPVTNHRNANNLSTSEHRLLFEYSVENKIDRLKALYDTEVFIQGDTPSENRRAITIGVRHVFRDTISIDEPRHLTDVGISDFDTVNIPEQYISGNTRSISSNIYIRRDDGVKAVYMYEKRVFAVSSYNNTVCFCDFVHNGEIYSKAFNWVLEQEWNMKDVETVTEEQLTEVLNRISPKKVVKIEVTTEFNKESFIADACTELAIITTKLKESYSIKERIYKKQLAKINDRIEAKINAAKLSSFIEGIKVAKNSDWILKNNRLVYTKRIIVKHICYMGKVITTDCDTFFADGISLTITPRPEQASCDSSFHANIYAGDENGTVCIGDLYMRPLNIVMEKLPKLLETCYMDAPHENEAQRLASNIFYYDNDANKKEMAVWGKSAIC